MSHGDGRRIGPGDGAFFEGIVGAVGTGVAAYDSDGTIVYANDAYADLLETTPETLEGRHVTVVNPDFDRDRFEAYWDSFDAGETRQTEARYRTLDGAREFRVSVTTTRTTIGGQEYHVGTVEEITEQVERYKRLVEHLPIGVFRATSGPDGEIKLLNEAMVDLFEADSKRQFKDTPVADLYPDPDDRKAFSDRLVEEGTVEGVELELETFDGDSIWCDVSGAAVEDGDETVFEVAIQDVTERKAYERDLRLFEEAVEQAGHTVMITDPEGTLEYVNPAFEEETGYGSEEALGLTPRILFSGKQDDQFYEQLWETIQAGEVWEAELVNSRRSGELYYVDQTIAPITDEDGEITHFVAIEYDVTDRKLREKRLSELNRILRHNLRNTVNIIKAHVREIEGELDAVDGQSPVSVVLDHVDTLETTSEKAAELRQFLKQEYATNPSCDLDAVVNKLRPELLNLYPDAEFTIDTRPVTAAIDPGTCRAILKEVVDNAVFHNDRAIPTVEISVERTGPDAVEIEVADNGPGIPVTERGAVEVGTEEQLRHGSGIGLSHVHALATQFGGDVDIGDNDPRGSVVTITLPTADDATET